MMASLFGVARCRYKQFGKALSRMGEYRGSR
jgi:hypothetical protein